MDEEQGNKAGRLAYLGEEMRVEGPKIVKPCSKNFERFMIKRHLYHSVEKVVTENFIHASYAFPIKFFPIL